jgi:hypothetical protein
MVVYVSEYYSGIAAQRKLDVAARRISKLISTTKHNDALRSEYNERAARLKVWRLCPVLCCAVCWLVSCHLLFYIVANTRLTALF